MCQKATARDNFKPAHDVIMAPVAFFSKGIWQASPMLVKARLHSEKQHDVSQMDLIEFHHIQKYFDVNVIPETQRRSKKSLCESR